MSLQEVEKVSITILMDNSTDPLLTDSAHVKRPPLIVNEKFNLPVPVAEHGFSALVNIIKDTKNKAKKSSVYNNSKNNCNNKIFLFDTWVSENGVLHNADIFGIRELGAGIHKTTGVSFLPSEESPSLLITGQIPRETSFEKGFPFQYSENLSDEKNLVPDPLNKMIKQ